MFWDTRTIARKLWETIFRPADIAREILALRLPQEALWLSLALVTVLSVLLVSLLNLVTPVPPEAPAGAMSITPMTYGLVLGGSLLVTVFALHYTGQTLGGQGQLADTLALVVWLQLLLVVLQAAQVILMVSLPFLGGLLALASVVIMIWALVNFVNEAQRFESLGRAFLTLVLAFLGIGFGISLILMMIGVGTNGGQI